MINSRLYLFIAVLETSFLPKLYNYLAEFLRESYSLLLSTSVLLFACRPLLPSVQIEKNCNISNALELQKIIYEVLISAIHSVSTYVCRQPRR